MNLYLVRHADALPLGAQGVTVDEARPLSEAGKKQAGLLAGMFKGLEIRVDRVVTSPLVRSRQTAEGLVQQLQSPGPELLTCDELAPGGSRRKLAKFIRDLGVENIVLVGHEPDLGRLAAWLIGGKKAQLEFAKAGVACIASDVSPGKGAGALLWLVTPRWMR